MEKEEKNRERQEFKGRNLEDVISHAEHVLKIPRSQFNYEIVAEKTKLFGTKTKEIVITAWPKNKSKENFEKEFLDPLLKLLPLDIQYVAKRKDDILSLIFEGPDKLILLQKEGELLLALQHILNKVSPHKVQADCDFFRKQKERELKDYVRHIAGRVRKSGQNEILDPMNPYERRLVHVTVNHISGISTESIGSGFLKRIKVFQMKSETS
jgi:spoIIIJ-associated protein